MSSGVNSDQGTSSDDSIIEFPDFTDDINYELSSDVSHDKNFVYLDSHLSICKGVDKPISDYQNQFTELEGRKLQQLLHATNVTLNYVTEFAIIYSKEMAEQKCYYSPVVNNYAKLYAQIYLNLTEFNCICDTDRLVLKKYLMPVFLLRWAPYYLITEKQFVFTVVCTVLFI